MVHWPNPYRPIFVFVLTAVYYIADVSNNRTILYCVAMPPAKNKYDKIRTWVTVSMSLARLHETGVICESRGFV